MGFYWFYFDFDLTNLVDLLGLIDFVFIWFAFAWFDLNLFGLLIHYGKATSSIVSSSQLRSALLEQLYKLLSWVCWSRVIRKSLAHSCPNMNHSCWKKDRCKVRRSFFLLYFNHHWSKTKPQRGDKQRKSKLSDEAMHWDAKPKAWCICKYDSKNHGSKGNRTSNLGKPRGEVSFKKSSL